MPIEIKPRELVSRTVREAITSNGERVLSTDLSFSDVKTGQGGVLGLFIDGGKALAGFLVKGAKSLIQWSTAQSCKTHGENLPLR